MPKKTFAILLAFAFVLIPMASSGADGADYQLSIDSSSVSIGEFTEGSPGTISIPIENESNGEITVDVYVTWMDGDPDVAEDRIGSAEGIKVPAEADNVAGKASASVSFSISSPGKHHVKIWFQPDTAFPNPSSGEPLNWITAEISVSDSIWNNASTYVLIVIVIIAVAAAVYLRLRSTRVPKAEGRFTAMETERRAQKYKSGDGDGTQVETPGSEKQEYTGRKTKQGNTANKRAKRRAK